MFLGLDLSLTSTGWAVVGPGMSPVLGRIQPDGLRGPARLAFIADSLEGLLQRFHVAGIGIEGYSIGSKKFNSRAHDLGELGGIVRLMCWRRGFSTLICPPKCVKKYGTGNGNADKAAMVRAVNETYKLGLRATQHDIADAMVIGTMAWARFGGRMPGRLWMLEALHGCEVVEGQKIRARHRPGATGCKISVDKKSVSGTIGI